MIVGASCAAELIQDDPGGLAKSLGLPIPIIALKMNAYQKKENWGAAETLYRLVRGLTGHRQGARRRRAAALHPRLTGRVCANAEQLPVPTGSRAGTVGLLLMRSYILDDNTAHYDAAVSLVEARGLAVIPAFANGLDARPAVDAFFHASGTIKIDALLSLTGVSLIGAPAYNDSTAAAEMLGALDVPYVAAQALKFQTLGNGKPPSAAFRW